MFVAVSTACVVRRKKEVEPRPPAAVNVATIPEDPTGSGGTGESGGIATRHTGSGRPVPHVRTPTAADPPSTPDAVRDRLHAACSARVDGAVLLGRPLC